MNKATVSTLVGELIEENLVYEIGPGKSSGGRRPVMLLFNKLAGYAIGVDLGVNYILTVLTDLQGNIVGEETCELHNRSLDEVIPLLKKSIQSVSNQTPKCTYGIVGIGIGVPGLVDDKGLVLFAPNLGWKNVNLKEMIATEFNTPVIIDNEANAGAYGEKLFGVGKGISNLVYVSAGIGIGTGIILNNELYRGRSGFSGEIGHLIIEVNGKKCSCGNKGCWELYASERALVEEATSLLSGNSGLGKEEIDLSYLVKLANQGKPEVIRLFNQIGEYLGIGITNIINTFNPEMIIIGNRLTMAEPWISNPIHRVVENRSLPYHRKDLRIEFSNLSVYSSALGAASLAVSSFFSGDEVSILQSRV
ncbi:ROK family protein [Lihuaxuella thermophila]|uniref:ROK family protein n=1 Tax=Lihuaxuella thermophila TaxID=1173111 RepID=UPI003138A132